MAQAQTAKTAQKPAAQQTQAKPQTKTNGAEQAKAQRGKGPVQVYFIDSHGNDHVRVPVDVRSVVVAVKGGANKSFDPATFSPDIVNGLLADIFAKRVKQQLANHGEDSGVNAVTEAEKVYNAFVSGKIYTRVTTGKAGRPAKVDEELPLLIDAYVLLKQYAEAKGFTTPARDGKPPQKIRAMTPHEIEDLRAEMGSLPRAKRNERIKLWNRQDLFKRIHADLVAKKLREKEKTHTAMEMDI